MGWWDVEVNGMQLEIGDQPLDALSSAMKRVAKSYRRSLKRGVTPKELEEMLRSTVSLLEEDLFDDMDERELDSVTISLRARPKRPRPVPGDIFAMPLPGGGYGYGRIMKISLRVLLWIQLLNVRSRTILPPEKVQKAKPILDISTRIQAINDTEWPIVCHKPFSPEDQAYVAKEPTWYSNYTAYTVQQIAEWKLSGRPGLPPDIALYEGYCGGLVSDIKP